MNLLSAAFQWWIGIVHFLDADSMARYTTFMGVFGSFAKGLQTPESDIDVVIVWKDGYADYEVRQKRINQLKIWSGRDIDLINYSHLMNPVVLHEIEKYEVEVGMGMAPATDDDLLT